MKRFTIFLLTMLFVLVLAVPAFASGYGVESKPEYRSYTYSLVSKSDDGRYWIIFSNSPAVLTKSSAKPDYYNFSLTNFYGYTSYDGSTWDNGKLYPNGSLYVQILWANYDVKVGGDTVHPSDVILECDGSACPATDLNADGICDDCGMTLSLRLTSYPTLPEVIGNNFESVVLQRDDGYFYMTLTSEEDYTVLGTVGSSYLITIAHEQEVNYMSYKCTDGKNWVHQSNGKAYSLSVGDSSATLLASTFDWYKDGEHFFPEPPSLAEVTEEALGTMTNQTMKTMWILVLCGVGCLALLMVLHLFGKRSLLFRS